MQDINRTYVLVIERFLLYKNRGFCKRRVIVECKEKIIEMVNEIDCEDYLFKIYHYILVKYRKYKEKKSED